MTLKGRLILGLGSLLLVLLVLVGSAINLMHRLNETIDQIVSDRYQKVELANIISFEISNISRDLRDIVLSKTQADLNACIERINQANTAVDTAMFSLEQTSKRNEEEVAVLLSRIKNVNASYKVYQDQVIQLTRDNQITEAIFQVEQSRQVRIYLVQLAEKINAYEEAAMQQALEQTHQVYNRTLVAFMMIVLSSLLFGGGIAFWLIRNITSNLGRLTRAIHDVSSQPDQTTLPRLEVTGADELGTIAQAFNQMANSLEEHAQQEQAFAGQLKDSNWVKTKQAEITVLFQGVQEFNKMAQLLITKLAQSVEAGYGAMYIVEGQGEQRELIRRGTYANQGGEVGTERLQLGEGLVGQCALENRVVTLEDLPETYIQISSGLGSAPPRCITLVPVGFEGDILAVIELASLKHFTPLQLELIEEIRRSTGIVLNRIANHRQVQRLLAESQALTEELQTQSEELQMQQEELKTFNEQLEEQYKKSEQKTKELEKAQLELEEKARQLALSSQYKSEFLSNMSHELRTPLNSMLILSRLLAENQEGQLTAKQVEYAETILSSGQDLLNLINDILDLAKVEAGKQVIRYAECSLESLMEDLDRQFSPVAQQRGLALTLQVDPHLPATFYTDSDRLKQILKNLLSNALKFTPQGQVQLQISRTQSRGTEPSSPMWSFAVSDTGIGIPSDKQGLIFEAFQQADGTTSRKYGGTGLGLSICQQLSTLLGGTLTLQSTPGEGSTFTLHLPEHPNITNQPGYAQVAVAKEQGVLEVAPSLGVEESQPLGESLAEMENLRGRRVLLVDDDMRNVFALTAALEGQQIEVDFAENGREALDKLQAPGIDLVLMDIMMPEMDGYQAIQAIRQLPHYQAVPIIALTAKAMRDDREKCLQAGASDYISKPFEISKLLSLMQVWLYRQVN